MMTLLLPTICLFACALCLYFESKEQQQLSLKVKLLASLAFVGFAWDLGAWQTYYGQLLFIGLVLSLCGDVLLAIKDNKKCFLIGIGVFLLAHIFYTFAFAQTGFISAKLPLIVPVVLIGMIISGLWLRKYLSDLFYIAVPAYLLAIGLMLVFAWCNQAISAYWWIVSGATIFAVSDLFVARNEFVKNEIKNPLVGLPLYYIAQLLLAYSVSLI